MTTTALSRLPAVIGACAPRADAGALAAALIAPMQSAGIVTPLRIAMFVGMIAEETGGFRALSEDLWYSSADRIRKVWPGHFANVAEAVPFVGRPAALANRVYANRMGNAGEESGDGWMFRGRGLIQITGRALYTALAKADARASDPEWLLTPAGAAVAACWYWSLPAGRVSLNAMADVWDVKGVTWRINGGLTNLDARIAMTNTARAVFGAAPPAPAAPTADDLMAAELVSLHPPAG